jgi:uncharacterized protein (DUF1330 family)
MAELGVTLIANLTVQDADEYRRYEDAARRWYEDPEYQRLSKHRRASSTLRFLTLVHDPPPRG